MVSRMLGSQAKDMDDIIQGKVCSLIIDGGS